MTNNDNNNERENEMTFEFDDFDTTVSNEETQAYSDYVDADELEAIEAEMVELEDEIDEITDELVDFDISFDDMVDSFNQFDDQRDLDFYES